MAVSHTLGRRKTAVARVYFEEGKGEITVNGKDFKETFVTAVQRYKIEQALNLTDTRNTYNVRINVYGGGLTGQVEAIRLAMARSLCKINPEHRLALKPEGLLTRDPRMVERKKFGQKKARKKFQFSKR